MTEYHVKHILLADDDTDHALLFKKILEDEFPGVLISAVHDGDTLFQFLHLHPVDILFLDLHMPCRNGLECLQEIRKDPVLIDLPVIVYSSSAQLSDIQRSFLHRADFYLVKPFRTDHLTAAMRLILSVNWREDGLYRNHYYMNNRFVPYTLPG